MADVDIRMLTNAAEQQDCEHVKKIIEELRDPDDIHLALRAVEKLNKEDRKTDSSLPELSVWRLGKSPVGVVQLNVSKTGGMRFEHSFDSSFPKSTGEDICWTN